MQENPESLGWLAALAVTLFVSAAVAVGAVAFAAKAITEPAPKAKGAGANITIVEHYANGQKRERPAVMTTMVCCEGGRVEYRADGLTFSTFEQE